MLRRKESIKLLTHGLGRRTSSEMETTGGQKAGFTESVVLLLRALRKQIW